MQLPSYRKLSNTLNLLKTTEQRGEEGEGRGGDMFEGSNGWNNSKGTTGAACVSKTLNGNSDSMHAAMSHKCLGTAQRRTSCIGS